MTQWTSFKTFVTDYTITANFRGDVLHLEANSIFGLLMKAENECAICNNTVNSIVKEFLRLADEHKITLFD